MSTAGIGVPVTMMGGQAKKVSSECTAAFFASCETDFTLLVDPLVHEDGELKMKFKLVTRKGQKQQVRAHDNHMTITPP